MGSKMPYCLQTNSISKLALFADDVAHTLSGGELIGLRGCLGSGKTTFTGALCSILGVDPQEVSSPSYVLQHRYRGRTLNIEHWDLYRISNALPEELLEPSDGNTVRIVEWIDLAPELEATADLLLEFQLDPESGERAVVAEGRLAALLAARPGRSG